MDKIEYENTIRLAFFNNRHGDYTSYITSILADKMLEYYDAGNNVDKSLVLVYKDVQNWLMSLNYETFDDINHALQVLSDVWNNINDGIYSKFLLEM